MLLKIDKELRWSLSYNGVSVEVGQCSLFSDIPPKLTSAKAVINLLSTFQKIMGNSHYFLECRKQVDNS